MSDRRRSAHAPLLVGLLLSCSALAGCASGDTATITYSRPTGDCVDDSKACIEQRGAALRAMMSDRKHSWVRERPTAHSYAAGVRLFAFRSRKRDLTCEELIIGKREADAAPTVLRGPGAGGLSPAQVSRGTLLAGEVSRELGKEIRRRSCRT